MNMKLLSEFRDFALKGSVVDLAVGAIIGAAFGRIVSSLVDNVLMPPLGFILGRVDFKDLAINLGTEQAPVLIRYGQFIQTMVGLHHHCVRAVSRAQGHADPEGALRGRQGQDPSAPTPSEIYLKEIRDALVKK